VRVFPPRRHEAQDASRAALLAFLAAPAAVDRVHRAAMPAAA
jgi:hypothetical protein